MPAQPPRLPNVFRLGLTGGIGSGKSSVAARLTQHGAVCLDADALARALTAPGGAALPALVERFGADCLGPDGAMNRDWMRARVFANPIERAALEAIVHPLVQRETALAAQRAVAAGAAWLVLDVPLLVESGHWRSQVSRVLVVDADPDDQVQRVMARSGLSAEAVRAIIASQASRAQRRAAADAVILNQGLSLTALHACVDAWVHAARALGWLPGPAAPAP